MGKRPIERPYHQAQFIAPLHYQAGDGPSVALKPHENEGNLSGINMYGWVLSMVE